MTLKTLLANGSATVRQAARFPGVSVDLSAHGGSVSVSEPALVVSEERAARMLSLAPRTLQDMRLRGDGPPYVALTGRRVGSLVSAIEDWALERSRQSTSAATRNQAVLA